MILRANSTHLRASLPGNCILWDKHRGFYGRPGGIRTPNLRVRSALLYPLSYGTLHGGEQWSRSTCWVLASTHSLAGKDEHSFALLSKNWLPTLGSNEEPPVSETGDLPVDLVGNVTWFGAQDSNLADVLVQSQTATPSSASPINIIYIANSNQVCQC